MTSSLTPAPPARRRLTARLARVGLALLAAFLVLAVVPSVRGAALRTLGGLLIVNDSIEPVDIAVMTENAEAGELELSDLYRDRVMPRVMVLTPAPSPADQKLRQRGVQRDGLTAMALVQLGIPRSAIATIEAGEGGTSDTTEALAAWVGSHPCRVLVVVSPSHARRYRRALRRVWPASAPPALVRYPRDNAFRVDDWWNSRRTRREGLFELQKLAWDYLRHPW